MPSRVVLRGVRGSVGGRDRDEGVEWGGAGADVLVGWIASDYVARGLDPEFRLHSISVRSLE